MIEIAERNHNMLNQLETLTFICKHDADYFNEVCIETKLPKEMEEAHKISEYDISVRFHDDGEVAVFVYDNKEETTTNIDFTQEVRQTLIEFAKEYI